MKISRKR